MKLVAAALLALSLHRPAAAPDVPLKSVDVTFTTPDGQRLGGRIFQPAQAEGKLPGLVLVHGSGDGNGWEDLRAEAEAFAAQGMVVLAPDKRSAGYSKTERDYGQLADDALAALTVLRKQPSVGRAGLWGVSEGGWVAPIAATRSKDVEFLVTVGGPGYSPLRTQSWNAANKVHRAGVRGSLNRAYAGTFHRLLGDVGLFPEADHDPAPTLARLTRPVLALWGAEDNQVMPAESAERFRANVHGSLTVRFFPNAGHSLRADDRTLVSGYADTVGSWVRRVAAGETPTPSADPYPAQETRSVEPPAPAWWSSWQLQLGGLVLMLLVFLGGVVRWRRLAWSARVVAASGVLSLAGFVFTMVTLVATSNSKGVSPGPLLLDRPVAWLAAQFLAVGTTVATLTCLARWRTASLGVRVVTATGLGFVPWALYWGLLLP
ncbi:prolyl oligopeptidase family serine peptidase [Streptosporangium sp. NPDC000239]|uniref:alpha/beta hydrolase family protein n=1 Tax=Streptosporangium sp. NPDC000239 TaxID=3154248 RepID=UPI0033343767